MTPHHAGFGLGVDLGTSNTVAVLRWPDGRTRPLLFDGQPLLPSGVFLDEAGALHVGRDARRLAQAAPDRYEPNPKRRVDEESVLLGDRDVFTADLLAVALRTVAQAAVEAAGFLPPAVLTYPASWGVHRRNVLATALGRAGWPPAAPHPNGGTLLVPEPVAAARYFTGVLRRPVPVGSALAVFDFGGGTLDIAVVRNEGGDPSGRPRFAVTSSGGVADLGGLDLDAALVEYLVELAGRTDPDAARRLTEPDGPVQWRDRRRFWDDVRGAKEMLSRTAVAPVPVPGLAQAAHLTRDELERLITPLVRRGVAETAAVISASGLAPHQLAGLFLVGGSSRVPLVARLLHAELGVAPTVLEQPELPVAEGALAELPVVPDAGSAPVSPPAPVPAASSPPAPAPAPPPLPAPPASPASAVSPPHPAPPPSGAGGGAARAGWRRSRRLLWPVGAAALALVVAAVFLISYLVRDDYPRLNFRTFSEIGSVSVGEERPSYVHTAVLGDRAYVAYEREDQRLEVVAARASTAKQAWRIQTSSTSQRWSGLTALPDALVVFADAISDSTPRKMIVLDAGNGRQRWSRDIHGDDTVHFFEEVAVLVDRTGDQLVGLDLRTGRQRWRRPSPVNQYGYTTTSVYAVTTTADLGAPANGSGRSVAPDRGDDQRIVQIGADRSAVVIDATNGTELKKRTNVADPDDAVLAHDGRLYVAAEENGYWLAVYDLASLGEPRSIYRSRDDRRAVDALAPCGSDRVCLLETSSSDRETTELVAVHVEAGGEAWRRPAKNLRELTTLGEYVAARSTSSEYVTTVFAPDGKVLFTRPGVGVRLDGGNLLVFADNLVSYADDASVAGFWVGSAEPFELGQLKRVRPAACSWNTSVIVCPTDTEFIFRRFAED